MGTNKSSIAEKRTTSVCVFKSMNFARTSWFFERSGRDRSFTLPGFALSLTLVSLGPCLSPLSSLSLAILVRKGDLGERDIHEPSWSGKNVRGALFSNKKGSEKQAVYACYLLNTPYVRK